MLLVKMTSGSILKDMPHFSQALCWAQPLDLPLPNRGKSGSVSGSWAGERPDWWMSGVVGGWVRRSLQGRHLSNVPEV